MIAAIMNEVGELVTIQFKGGCADNEGLPELIAILKHCDDLPIAMEEDFDDDGIFKGSFSSQREWDCLMHSEQRTLSDIIDSVLGQSCMKNDATCAQNLYVLHK